MKKFLASFMLVAGIGMIGLTPTMAGATNDKPVYELPEGSDGFKKATICHWANGNVHAISVSFSALSTHLVWHAEGGWAANPGHEGDKFLHFGKEVKPDDDEECGSEGEEPADVTLFACFNGEIEVFGPGKDDAVNAELDAYLEANVGSTEVEARDSDCDVVETTTTTAPATTTTTAAPTTTTTAPTVAPVPVANCSVTTTDANGNLHGINGQFCPKTVVAPPVVPVAAPKGALPHTGAATNVLAMLGLGLALIGLSIRMLAKKAVA